MINKDKRSSASVPKPKPDGVKPAGKIVGKAIEETSASYTDTIDPGIFGFILHTANDAVYVFNDLRQIIYVNECALKQSGYSREELLCMTIADLDPEYPAPSPDEFRRRAQLGERMVFDTMHLTRSGALLPVEVSLMAAVFEDKTYNSAFVRDRSERDRAEQAHQESEERFRLIADTSPVALVISEVASGRIHYANSQAARLFQLPAAAMNGLSFHELLESNNADPDLIAALCAGEKFQNCEIHLRRGELRSWGSLNSSRLVLEGIPMYCSAILDITEAHELSNQLSYQATYDALTGLVNRREFEDRLQEVIELAQARRSDNVVCYLDLDQFKVINDTCGHMAGDEFLRLLARELFKGIDQADTLARLGGDEFAILMENCMLENAERVANDVRQIVQNFSFFWQGNVFKVGVSIGLTVIAQQGETISDVLRRADAACNAAKEAGRNRLHVFRLDDKELTLRNVEMRWVARINAALDENRFELWAQQIAEINRTETLQGLTAEDHFEVLLRLRETDGSLIMPGTFLPAAERYALAAKIDRWVLRNLFRWLGENLRIRNRIGMCAVNLSGQTLSDEHFHNEVIELLETFSIPPEKICFEITETSAIANLVCATQFMQRLRDHGCTFALDDFGSGLSSFAYLKSLPVDFVKIDGLFVKDILSDPVDRAMVKAIIDMAHALGKKTIAEFVENDAILHELIDLNIDYVQGYGIARPCPLI
jgi:diguanylate cyclase (GGDEF)-like protein/PAS domain S-box-containing protein